MYGFRVWSLGFRDEGPPLNGLLWDYKRVYCMQGHDRFRVGVWGRLGDGPVPFKGVMALYREM